MPDDLPGRPVADQLARTVRPTRGCTIPRSGANGSSEARWRSWALRHRIQSSHIEGLTESDCALETAPGRVNGDEPGRRDLSYISKTYVRCSSRWTKWQRLLVGRWRMGGEESARCEQLARSVRTNDRFYAVSRDLQAWPDFPVQSQIYQVGRTVKADAAFKSFGAAGAALSGAVIRFWNRRKTISTSTLRAGMSSVPEVAGSSPLLRRQRVDIRWNPRSGAGVFEGGSVAEGTANEAQVDVLYRPDRPAEGRKRFFLARKLAKSERTPRAGRARRPALPVLRNVGCCSIARIGLRQRPRVNDEDGAIMALIDRQYLARPYYGSRAWRRGGQPGPPGQPQRVQRLMRLIGLVAVDQRRTRASLQPRTRSIPICSWVVDRSGQPGLVSDITYIPMAKGCVSGRDHGLHSRAVLAWRLSNTLGRRFLRRGLEDALARYGKPEVFNTDQGCQFTGTEFTGVLEHCGITISMDGKGRCMATSSSSRLWRSLKYEEVYLHAYASVCRSDARIGTGSASQRGAPHIRAMAIARRGSVAKHNAVDIVDDRLCRRLRFPRFPSQLEKAGKCSPSPTSPPAQPPIQGLIKRLLKVQ